MKRHFPLLLAAAATLIVSGPALAGGFGRPSCQPRLSCGRPAFTCGSAAPSFCRPRIPCRLYGPSYNIGGSGCVNFGYGYGYAYGGFGSPYYGDTFGGFVYRGAFGPGFVTVTRGRLSVSVPFQLPTKCGVGFGSNNYSSGFQHFSGVHDFYRNSSSVADYASYYATKRHAGFEPPSNNGASNHNMLPSAAQESSGHERRPNQQVGRHADPGTE